MATSLLVLSMVVVASAAPYYYMGRDLPRYVVRADLEENCADIAPGCKDRGVIPCGTPLSSVPSCVQKKKGRCCCPKDVQETCSVRVFKYYQGSIDVNEVAANNPLPPAGPEWPTALQGIFWLQDQKDGSSLITFANSPSQDGARAIDPATGELFVDVGGDRTWSFADYYLINDQLLNIDNSLNIKSDSPYGYQFTFNDAKNPTQSKIVPKLLDVLVEPPTWLVAMSMDLLPDGLPDIYPGSVIWQRLTTISPLKLQNEQGNYKFVQVFDGAGNKIQPAFDLWKEAMQSPTAGRTPGRIWFRSSEVECAEKCEGHDDFAKLDETNEAKKEL